jgi:hypothetical protein
MSQRLENRKEIPESRREYLASMFMAAILSNSKRVMPMDFIVESAIIAADMFIEQFDQPTEK